MSHFVLLRANRPSGGGSAVGSALSGGTASRFVTTDASGNIATPTTFRNDATGRACFGGTDAFDPNLVVTGTESFVEQRANLGTGADLVMWSENQQVIGGAGYFAYAGGFTVQLLAQNSSKSGTLFGRNKASSLILAASGGPLLIGPSTNHEIVVGKGIAHAVTSIADTNATMSAACANTKYTSLSANRVFTLVAANSVGNGFRTTVSLNVAAGGFKVDVTRAGADTIGVAGTTYALDTDCESVTIESDGTSKWIVVATN